MTAVLSLPRALVVSTAASKVTVEALRLDAGEWLLLRPDSDAPSADPASALARALAALEGVHEGQIELFGDDVAALGYAGMAALRKRLAFVPGSGGLLSNRTLRENVALPISVHRAFEQGERRTVTALLARFELLQVADLHAHQVTGTMRHRTCVARASSLSPALYVVEGTGEFVSAIQPGLSWRRLLEERARGVALVACVARTDEDFEHWFTSVGGRMATYRTHPDEADEEGWLP
jgi:predicted ABC-type transport system involved in lysophospholipase L1 biosynthesis ATPase subunit